MPRLMHTRISIVRMVPAGLCVLPLLLSACGTFEVSVERTPAPEPGPTTTIGAPHAQDTQLADQAVTLAPLAETSLPVAPPQPTPQEVLGGGTVSDGPFIFDLRLFRDPNLNRHPVATSLYSDMEGTGAWMYWFYGGADAIGPVETYWGTLPQLDQLLQETYASVQLGDSGGRTGGVLLPGGIFLPGESTPGDPVQVALKVVTPDGEYGAVLGFTLKEGVNGFEPANVSVDVLKPVTLTPAP